MLHSQMEEGQGLVEYALILVLIAVVVIVALSFLGDEINRIFNAIGSILESQDTDGIQAEIDAIQGN
jgi:pilus assembly protein Flp/PilA